ncbi:hypothetical protein [Saccharothrix syringae]|uniref:Carboxypeptidase regulatory-like domain-containing protein n=1 Tax=Saccharothrix syringae TaxID=103733 RepID=A0A5Q0H3K0_SACSY|nr:hypothetical protein [Saccharothrix syringae]QFZ20788.1 hypothetical protein EKG83_28375 [Saccharothrix syringae]
MTRFRKFATAALGALVVTTLATAPAVADSPVPTQLTASVDTMAVDVGQEITVTGRITRQGESGPVGVPGGRVVISLCGGLACSTLSPWMNTEVYASMGGYFTKRFAPPRTGFLLVQFVPSAAEADLLPSSTTTPQISVFQESIHGLSAVVREADGRVQVSGMIGFPAEVVPPSGLVARIEFSADGVAWTTLATTGVRQLRWGYYLYTVYVVQPASGYWRGVYDGHPTSAKPATSQVVHLV